MARPNRFGLTEISTPAGGSNVDVVFVHGINGHPYDTWTSEKYKTFWPAQLLPPLIEEAKARVLVYGYDADTGSPTEHTLSSGKAFDVDDQQNYRTPLAQDRIHHHAETLIASLCANRRNRHAVRHPIVFVAHSLGGIVVKRALIHSAWIRGKNTRHLRSIDISTYGILFLGTPHFGMQVAKWNSWSEDITCTTQSSGLQAPIFDALKPNSEILQNIDRQFSELAREFHIFYFHEMKPTKLANGWRYIVDEVSAAPVTQDVERAGIQQDHIHMCTFEDDGTPGFVLVTEAIQRYATDSMESVQQRWVTESAEQQLRFPGGLPSGISRIPLSNPVGQVPESLPTSDHAPIDTTSSGKPQLKHYVVPRDRVKSFVGREAQLKEISAYFASASTQEPRILILCALGGQGKSQIVLEYCRRQRVNYRGVFWVDASSEALALQSYIRITMALSGESQLTVKEGEKTIEIVKARLQDWNEPWLLVFDNYDKPDDFTDVRRFLPKSDRGHVIFTSRRRDLDRLGTPMELLGLSLDEGVDLLLRRYSKQVKEENLGTAQEIVRRLGCLALAIDQAAAYIAYKRIPLCGLGEFLALYNKQRKQILSYTPSNLWEYRSMQMQGPEDQMKSINAFTTWEISLNQLTMDNPQETDAAIHFLTLSAFFNPARIEESLFRNHWRKFNTATHKPSRRTKLRHVSKRRKKSHSSYGDTRPPPLWLHAIAARRHGAKSTSSHQELDDGWDTDRFWDFLTQIHELCLVQNIETDNQGASFSLHPLVRDWLQLREQSVDHQNYLTECFVMLANSAFVSADFDKVSVGQRAALVNHIDACMLIDEQTSEPQNRLGNEKMSYDTATWLADTYHTHGRYESAEILLDRITNDEDADIMYFTQLHSTLIALGKYEKAENLSHRSRQLREETVDKKNPKRLAFMTSIAYALVGLGRHDEAEPIKREILQLKQEVLGRSHRQTLISMSALADLLQNLNKYTESVALAREALKDCETVLKKNDPIKFATMETMALALRGLGQFIEAETTQREVVRVRQQLRGVDHPETLTSMDNLACILESTNREEAEELYRQVIESRKKVLHEGHPDTLISMQNLAILLRDPGQHDEAETIQREVVQGWQQSQGMDHPKTLVSMHQLATILEPTNMEAAEELYRQVIKSEKKVLCEGHPDTVISMENLASLLRKQGKHAEAEELDGQIVEIEQAS
ncbi:MAG: hypothetical protein Q9171_002999 [Xanthocarpia ochracea]